MKRWYHKAAQREFNHSVLWYEEQKPGLGAEFFAAVQETVGHIIENPRRFPMVYRDLRQAPVSRFPFLIFFVSKPNRLEIFSVFHTSRAPEIWKERRDRN